MKHHAVVLQVGLDLRISKIRLSKQVKEAYKHHLKSLEVDDKSSSTPMTYNGGKAVLNLALSKQVH